MQRAGVRVWDLPTRVFHAAFALVVVFAWLTGQFGGTGWRDWHLRAGYVLLGLLVFRALWGFAGPRYARFSSFALTPRAIAASFISTSPRAGHSPRGALSVIAMLVLVGLQVVTGLFATDGNFIEGPWTIFVGQASVDTLTGVHSFNRWLVLAAVVLHLAAIAWYAMRRDPLVAAIFTGERADLPAATPATADGAMTRWRATVFAAAAAALAAYLVTI